MRQLLLIAVLVLAGPRQLGVGCEGCGPLEDLGALDGGVDGGAPSDAGREDGGALPDAGGTDGAVAPDGGSDGGGALSDAGPEDGGAGGGGGSDGGVAGPDGGGTDGGSDGGVVAVDGGSSDAGPACPGGPTVFTTGMSARFVIGQPVETTRGVNAGNGTVTSLGLDTPRGVAIHGGRLFVSDGRNNRILVYDPVPTANGASASAVIGQPDFTTRDAGAGASGTCDPQNFSFSGTHLVVPEACNNRVSFWDLTQTPPSIRVVVGQGDVNSSASGVGPAAMATPVTARVVGPRLYVADLGNNRVLGYLALPTVTGASADFALGQPDLVSRSTGPALGQLDGPLDAFSDGTRLGVIDSSNNRVLLYDQQPSTTGQWPDFALGGYTLPPTQTSQQSPVGGLLAFGKMFVADRSNHRVLVWSSAPVDAGTPPDVVLGQADWVSGACNRGAASPTAATLCSPHFLFYDGCRLYLTDTGNHRVVVY